MNRQFDDESGAIFDAALRELEISGSMAEKFIDRAYELAQLDREECIRGRHILHALSERGIDVKPREWPKSGYDVT